MNRKFLAALLLAQMLVSPLLQAQQPLVTLRSTVTGNQEQPKVMYIVPWQQPGATDFEYSPASALAEDLFQRVDREEFVRELEYRELLADVAAEPVNQE